MTTATEPLQSVPLSPVLHAWEPDAERALLGVLLDFNDALGAVSDLRPGEFADGMHRDVYTAILAEAERGRPWDAVTIADRIVLNGAYICSLSGRAPTSANVAQYARIIRQRALQRKAQAVLEESSRVLRGADAHDVDTAVGQALDALQSLQALVKTETLSPMADDVLPMLKSAEEIAKRGDSLAGLSTGFYDLDRVTSGLQPSDLIILAARTSCGKTALAMLIAYFIAKARRHVAVFSLEMDRRRLTARMVAAESGLPVLDVLTGKANWTQVQNAAAKVSEVGAYLHLDCRAGLTPGAVRAALRRLPSPPELVVIDYLQLMRAPGRQENRQVEVSAISGALKNLAKSLNVPVLALSQFSRQADAVDRNGRPGGPQLSWLRESGSLEQDADIVLALHHGDAPANNNRPREVDLYVLKNRSGPQCSLTLLWEPACVRFRNCTQDTD
jgi:replicative DNA helicase